MKMISKKKQPYPVNPELRAYLNQFGRTIDHAVHYVDLLRYKDSLQLLDRNDRDTLWSTLSYDPADLREIQHGLLEIYSLIRSSGDSAKTQHLKVDRIDLCLYGNSKPFRIRIINSLNENFDYFYIKQADASRIVGMELEYILSPNRVAFYVAGDTMIEEHISGIPGDMFIDQFFKSEFMNEVRLAKEFVKFNTRCFAMLLGDMHSANFVINLMIDFDDYAYRVKAIDFDQEAYEGRKEVYLPQFYKENQPYVDFVQQHLTKESIDQYREEELSLMRKRRDISRFRYDALVKVLGKLEMAPHSNLLQLRSELSSHYNDRAFLGCRSMGELVALSIERI